MRGIFTFLFFGVLAVSGWGQVTFYTLDFDGQGSYTTTIGESSDGTNDYYTSTANNSIGAGNTFGNIDGDFFAAHHTSSAPTVASSPDLDIAGVDISGHMSLEVCVDIAEDDDGSAQDWDADSQFRLNYQIDNGGYNDGFHVQSVGGTNTEPAVDTDFDGIGDGATITDDFTQYCFTIANGNTLDIKIEVRGLDAGDEDIAFDNIIVRGVVSGPTCGVILGTATYTCSTNTFGTDMVTVNIPYTGSDAGITGVTTTPATNGGDDPASVANGTITITGLSEDDAWDITLNGGPCDGETLSGTVPATECDPICPLTLSNIDADCDAFTAGTDTYSYFIDFAGGGQGASTYTITSASGTVDAVSDDPDVDATGSLLITGVPEGTDDVLTITSASCMLMETITSPSCVPTVLEFTSATYTADEDDGTVSALVCVSIVDPAAVTTTVEVALTGGTATNGDDISTYATETLTFSGGSSSNECITITITDDTVDEPDETLEFTLQNPGGSASATLGSTTVATLTIVDNDISCPDVGDLVITEIMQDPVITSDGNGEYFEVLNTIGSSIDMQGMVISDDGSDSHIIASSLIVAPGDYATLSRASPGFTSDYVYTGINLANGDDEIVITCNGVEIDRVAYDGGPSFPDPSGASMSLSTDVLDATSNNDGANWCVSTSDLGNGDLGTPGAANDECCLAFNDIVIAPASTTTVLQPADICQGQDGYTYYGDGSGDYFFAINWNPAGGTIDATNQAARNAATVSITTNDPGAAIDGTQGTWTMERYWNVDNAGTFNDPVNVKFYYLATERTGTDTDASNSGYPEIEDPKWFKTTGVLFNPNNINAVAPGQGAMELTDENDAAGATNNGILYAEFEGVTSFSGGTYATGAGPNAGVSSLPVEFASVSARATPTDDVLVSWTTAQEINNAYFEVQHSADGMRFETVGMVEGQGTYDGESKYDFIDVEASKGVNYYRIAQVDFDGTTSFSDVVSVDLAGEWEISIRPTLVSDRLYYDIGDYAAKMIIMSLDGSIYKEIFIDNQGDLDFSVYAPGLYTITVVSPTKSVTTRITKI